jgi:hypothetical protein
VSVLVGRDLPLHIYLWLIREVPFTSLHVLLQSGKFDHTNRTFASVREFWVDGLKSINNSRELVPEFYFSPDFLVHESGFDFGGSRRSAALGAPVAVEFTPTRTGLLRRRSKRR